MHRHVSPTQDLQARFIASCSLPELIALSQARESHADKLALDLLGQLLLGQSSARTMLSFLLNDHRHFQMVPNNAVNRSRRVALFGT